MKVDGDQVFIRFVLLSSILPIHNCVFTLRDEINGVQILYAQLLPETVPIALQRTVTGSISSTLRCFNCRHLIGFLLIFL